MIVRYHPLARDEIIEATSYYAKIRPELGRAFRDQSDAAVKAIAANPKRFEQIRPGIRRCLLERFPYGVYFRTPDANTIRIIVVQHHRRRPGFGLRRT